MVDKLKKGEKSEGRESELSHPAKRRKLGENARVRVKGLAQLEKFEKSKIGQDVLSFFEAESTAEILEDEGRLYHAVSMLGGEPDQVDREGALAFLVIASKKFPDFIKGCLCEPGFDVQLHDRLIAEMGWDPVELPSVAIEPFKPRKTAVTPKSRASMEEVEKTALVEELKKTEAFRLVFELCETNSLERIMSDPEKLDMALLTLGADHNHVDPRQFGAFVLRVAESNPQFVFDYFLSKPLAEMADPDCKGALVQLLVAKGFSASVKIFEPVELVEGIDPYEVKKTFLKPARPNSKAKK